MNYLLPENNILSMHCSANVGDEGDVAFSLVFLEQVKQLLSADPNRQLIGDDEHGWSSNGVFNIEGGCYAKMHQSYLVKKNHKFSMRSILVLYLKM